MGVSSFQGVLIRGSSIAYIEVEGICGQKDLRIMFLECCWFSSAIEKQ